MKIIYKHISNASLDGNYAEDEAISVIFPKFPQRERKKKKKKKKNSQYLEGIFSYGIVDNINPIA
jgi:hypothetical protein